ncbi:MAG: dihydroorotase [Verrucomicrobia bacterium]|nr:dihydroorotase [Verrucomicrobiota bacterium]
MKRNGTCLITGGRVIDPSQNLDTHADVLIRDGRVAEIGKGLKADKAATLDASGCVVAPGLIDMHVHLREPGFEYKEDIASGTRAAAHGGFTSVACMPNTNPVIDTPGVIDLICMRAEEAGVVNVFCIGAISTGLEGKDIANIGLLVEAGAVAVSDDGKGSQDNYVLRRALDYAKMFGVPYISHAEDKRLAADGVMHEGHYSTLLGLSGIPSASEEIHVARNAILAELTGTPCHIAHISSAGSVRIVREAKARGVPITAEVTPHHFALTDACITTYDANFKMNPPLRSEDDRQALLDGLRDGTIDCIVTDHAPHSWSEKQVEFPYAAFGVIGLETALSVACNELLHKGVLDLRGLIDRLTCAPAHILNLNTKGSLRKGVDGDVTVFDPDAETTVNADTFASKSRNTPFNGWKLKGAPVATVVAGHVVWNARAASKAEA